MCSKLDSFFSEFDMVVRWGLARNVEMHMLNTVAIIVVFFTDLHGTAPSDLGLRPDGTVRSCAVQSQVCLSSSSDPSDRSHYAPPFRWARDKSPDQAFEEVKQAYSNYPKKGLRWSYGWIDRGGWHPKLFSQGGVGGSDLNSVGPETPRSYFYAQADSLIWRFTDDVELVLDPDRREVQYRSSSRWGGDLGLERGLGGGYDFDVQRLRYNQFVRMLEARGGWDVAPLPPSNFLWSLPRSYTEGLLIGGLHGADALVDSLQLTESPINENVRGIGNFVKQYWAPLELSYRGLLEGLWSSEPYVRFLGALQELQENFNNIELGPRNVRTTYQDVLQRTASRIDIDVKEFRDAVLDRARSLAQPLQPSALDPIQPSLPSPMRIDKDAFRDLCDFD